MIDSTNLPEADPSIIWDAAADRLYETQGNMLEDWSEIVSLLRLTADNETILDIGCGFGRVIPVLEAFLNGNPQRKYVGVDCSPKMIEKAKLLHPSYDFRVGSIGRLEEAAPETYDAFLMIRSIANIRREDLGAALSNVRARLRPGAAGLITTDYGTETYHTLRPEFSAIPDNHVLTSNEWLPENLSSLMKTAGFRVRGAHSRCSCHFSLFVEAE